MIMILLLICLFYPTSADIFNTTHVINHFTTRNDLFYITTASNSYLLNTTLQIQHEFSKHFTKSSWLYVNDTSYLECGVRLSGSDACCFERNVLDLSSKFESNSSNLCQLFSDNRYFFPYYVDNAFFVLTSYYHGGGGRTSRLYIDSSLKYSDRDDLHIGAQKDRFIVISPKVEKFTKYIVVLGSIINYSVLYFDPDINVDSVYQTTAELSCEGSNKKGVAGFSLLSKSSLKLNKSIINYDHNMHFIIFQHTAKYHICVYMEDLKFNMYRDTHLADSSKNALVSFDDKVGKIQSVNGVFVNGGLVIYYSVREWLYKLVMMKGDIAIRTNTAEHPVYTASGNISKIMLSSPNLGYVSTDYTIESFLPYDCNSLLTCDECTTMRDPHCGWCTLEGRCGIKGECTTVNMWTQKADKCLGVSVSAANKDIMADGELKLDLINSTLSKQLLFSCVFESGDQTRSSNGTVNGGTEIVCPVPQLTATNSGLLQVTVSVKYNGTKLGEVLVDYHQCNLYNKCQDCSRISKYCTWCILDGKCSLKSAAICDQTAVMDPKTCPAITMMNPKKIPRQTYRSVILSIDNLPDFKITSTNIQIYKCRVSSKISDYSHTYDILNTSSANTIHCNDILIDESFPEFKNAESPLVISLVYSPNNVDVVIGELSVFACELLTSDCIQCVSSYSHEEYSCRYCTNTCAHNTATVCETGTAISDNSYDCLLNNTVIEQITPSWSPGEGGVPIRVKGKSLSVDDKVELQFKITDHNNAKQIIPCNSSKFFNSTSLECETPNIMEALKLASMVMIYNATIIIKYSSGKKPEKFESNTLFQFTPLDIDMVYPASGPESGGTRVTLNGTHLCHPGHTFVTISDNDCTDVRCNLAKQQLDCLSPSGNGDDQKIQLRLGKGSSKINKFSYKPDPVVDTVFPQCALSRGGTNITVNGTHFSVVQRPLLLIGDNSLNCKQSFEQIAPIIHTDTELVYKLNPITDNIKIAFKMDGVTALCEKAAATEIVMLDDPSVFLTNINTVPCEIGATCFINVQMTQIHRFPVDQVIVTIGTLRCVNQTIVAIVNEDLTIGNLSCVAPSYETLKSGSVTTRTKRSVTDTDTDLFSVRIMIGAYEEEIGRLEFVSKGFDMLYIYAGAGALGGLIMIIMVIVVCKSRKDQHKMFDLKREHKNEIDRVEATYADAARCEFTELTLMPKNITDIQINNDDIPYRIFSDYLFHIMFPNTDKRKIINNFQLEQLETPEYKLQEFKKMLNNTHFLLTFIEIIEKQRDFQVAHRCEVASYLTCALYSDFYYLSHVLFRLLDKLIEADIKRSPKLLLRATKSVAEKLLTNWLSLTLYNYLYEVTGPSLYKLCYTINLVVEQGPLDYVTHNAKFSLSQDKLLSEKVEYSVLHVHGEGPDGVKSKGSISLLDCDTITQVKGKLYRAIYQHQPYSQHPNLESLILLWTPAQSNQVSTPHGTHFGAGSMELSDTDDNIHDESGENRFNTLKTYKVGNGDLLKLTMFSNSNSNNNMCTIRSAKRQTVSEVTRYHLVKNNQLEMEFKSPAPKRPTTMTKIASEAFLNSLIRTKEQLNSVFENMIKTIFMETNIIPPAMKYLFDYLDSKTEMLSEKERGDPEIAHIWKTNSLPLRFWINIMKNPQFLFDIDKPPIMDSYLSVIGQCFMDSCSLNTMHLNKDSSANKLVYNREVQIYRDVVTKWYNDVRQSRKVNLRAVVHDSKLPQLPFKHKFAVSQLFNYAQKYHLQIAEALPTQDQEFTRSDFEVLMKNSPSVGGGYHDYGGGYNSVDSRKYR